MWSRESIVEEMAGLLWSSIAPDRGRVPRSMFQAGEDLAALYEETNGTSLSDIARRMHGAAPDLDVEVVGVWLAAAALGDADDHALDTIARAGVGVPTFELSAERSDGGLEISWDGTAARRNPARAEGTRMMLLEDDPILQDGTGRWMKKIHPDTPLLVVDNVDAAIANLKHHVLSLIVSDVDVIGNQNGIDFFRYVKQYHPDLVDKFVFFTGNSAAADEHYRYVPKGAATSKDLKAAIAAPAPGGRAKRGTKAPTKPPAGAPRGGATVAQVVEVVRDVAPTIRPQDGPDGKPKTRFGDRKIFISALWRAASKDSRLEGMSFEGFKKALLAAHRERLISMARADLVAAMDEGAVAASEFEADGATFHFVIDPTVGGGAVPRPSTAVQISAPPSRAAGSPGTPSVQQIAHAVLAALPQIKATTNARGEFKGRVGERKVFIGPIWDIVSRQYPDLTRGQFDHSLWAAQRQDFLLLARADVNGQVDEAELEASEVRDATGWVHFVIDPNAKQGW